VRRDAQPYVGRRESSTRTEFARVAGVHEGRTGPYFRRAG
jgi:hypothetical protein